MSTGSADHDGGDDPPPVPYQAVARPINTAEHKDRPPHVDLRSPRQNQRFVNEYRSRADPMRHQTTPRT